MTVKPACFALRLFGRTRLTLYSSGFDFTESGFRGFERRFHRLVVRPFMATAVGFVFDGERSAVLRTRAR